MSEYEVNIRVMGQAQKRRSGGGRPPKCTFSCAYCGGTGRIESMGFRQKCEICGGVGKITMDISCDKLVDCGYCKGTGKIESMGLRQPCDVCHGHGRVKL